MHRLARLLLLVAALGALWIAPALAQGFRFVHVSDTHISSTGKNGENLLAIAGEVNAMNPQPAFVVVTGDLTETGATAEFAKYKEITAAFKMPVYNVSGNHETKWSNWGKFGIRKFLGQEPFYSFDRGGIHFVGLDSAMWTQHHGLLDQSLLTWLTRDLDKAGRATPSVLFYHHCPGFTANEDAFLRILRPYNVRLILVGHGHSFKTWKRNGLFFQECKGSMNNQGGFRLLEVTNREIRSFTKLVGGEPAADGVLPLAAPTNPVTLIGPHPDEQIEGPVRVRAMVGANRAAEVAIDGKRQPATVNADGICEATVDFTGIPGWHTVSVISADADGMEWSDSAPVRIHAGEREAWRVHVSGAVQRAVAAVGDRLYFGTLGGDVYCLEARAGRTVWKQSFGSDVISTPAVLEAMVYFGTIDGRVIALDLATGEKKWSFQTGGPIQASPTVAEGQVFVGSGEAAFYALDARTGMLRWKFGMERMTQVRPVYMNGAVYFGAWDRAVHALDAKTGAERWKTPIGAGLGYSPSHSDPATDGTRIAVTAVPYNPEDPDILCLDAKSGKLVWKIRTHASSWCGFNGVSAEGDHLFAPMADGQVLCLRMTDGKELWRTPTSMMIVDGKPVSLGGRVFLAGLRGNVACLNAADGKPQWTYSTGTGYIFTASTPWNDLLIVPSTDGTVTALRR